MQPSVIFGGKMGSANFDARSFWQKHEKPLFHTLVKNLRVDTCVIGAGITGLSVAYQLLMAGQQVAVLERERLGLGETGLSTGILSAANDNRYYKIKKWHGAEGAAMAAESHLWAIDEIERLTQVEEIDCDFERVTGYLFAADSHSREDLKHELEAAREAGLPEVFFTASSPAEFFFSGPCLVFPNQAQLHPLKYLAELAEVVRRRGGQIFTHTEAVELRGGYPALVKTRQGFQVECDAIVEATCVPINNKIAIHTKNAAHRSYVVAIPIVPDLVENAFFWDTDQPYHYFRFAKDPVTQESLLLAGGEDHRTGQNGQPEKHFENLTNWVHKRLGLESRPRLSWSGQIMETIDGLAYIGRNPMDHENVFIATGDSGHGLTHATIAGIILRDLILGLENRWSRLYDPRRLHVRNLAEYFKGAIQSTRPLMDWVGDGDVHSAEEIAPGEGAILKDGLKRIAVYKDELRRLHCLSAACSHLGGRVHWNSAEKTWDCPCHGSRYDRFGQPLNGPAVEPLKSVEEPRESGVEIIRPRQSEA